MKKLLLLSLCLFSTQIFAQTYQASLAGKRLILTSAKCAGLEFNKNATSAKWRNEIECQINDNVTTAWRVTWVNNEIFFLTETVRPNETSPPRNYIYQITSLNGKKLTVKDYWSGWNNFKTETTTYTVTNP